LKARLSLGNDSAPANDPQVTIFDCLIHTGNHASRKLSDKIDIVTNKVIQVMNCNTMMLLNNRIF
jgi:hypothetical protein